MKTKTIQEYSSAETSINKIKLPAVLGKINWKEVHQLSSHTFPRVLDYGCGRYTDHIKKFINMMYCLYYPYDPYWGDEYQNEASLFCEPDIVICSNVLNVIKEDEIVSDTVFKLLDYKVDVVISIYEGDKSGVGRKTKKNCWQRNQTKDFYCLHHSLSTYHGFITNDKTVLF